MSYIRVTSEDLLVQRSAVLLQLDRSLLAPAGHVPPPPPLFTWTGLDLDPLTLHDDDRWCRLQCTAVAPEAAAGRGASSSSSIGYCCVEIDRTSTEYENDDHAASPAAMPSQVKVQGAPRFPGRVGRGGGRLLRRRRTSPPPADDVLLL